MNTMSFMKTDKLTEREKQRKQFEENLKKKKQLLHKEFESQEEIRKSDQ